LSVLLPRCLFCSLSLRSFFLSCILRSLPSFPTRRSSDLAPAAPRGPAVPAARPRPALHPHRGERRAAPRSAASLLQHARPAGGTDRKSTRLNSSHVSISYAVFCLKKKKETKTTHT